MSAAPTDLAEIEAALPGYVTARRWFRGKARPVARVQLATAIPLPIEGPPGWLAVVTVGYADGEDEDYALPLLAADAAASETLRRERPHLVVAPRSGGGAWIDLAADGPALRALLDLVARDAVITHEGSVLRFRRVSVELPATSAPPRLVAAEQSNTSVIFEGAYVLKLIRKLDEGVSADLEMGEFLTRAGYAHAPAVAGAIDLARGGGAPATVGILHGFVPNRGDAWGFFLERLAGGGDVAGDSALVARLAQRVAEMHVALAPRADVPAFAPEPLARTDRGPLAAAVRQSLRAAFAQLAAKKATLPADAAALVATLGPREGELLARLDRFVAHEAAGQKIRVHGDLHLGQVLVSGDDFVLIDFEGEPARPLAERKAKRSPLADVAGLLRSLHYAAITAARAGGPSREAWHAATSRALVDGYLAGVGRGAFLPGARSDVEALLDFYRLEKCTYELHYELNNRPDWVAIPLAGLVELLERTDAH